VFNCQVRQSDKHLLFVCFSINACLILYLLEIILIDLNFPIFSTNKKKFFSLFIFFLINKFLVDV